MNPTALLAGLGSLRSLCAPLIPPQTEVYKLYASVGDNSHSLSIIQYICISTPVLIHNMCHND
ncbi:hypothetical protein PR003_g6783 [Phytophthora rubi]|uniref:Uncharacterized protein n=1 Tax=Phytophthora rubi TaxID=129364 RepID=A0A6A3N0J8_9STRA|nr:hypothetical protein PR002_g6798 [Phytophthora rubi]KAE9038915.1 hypothetical protein PR001_g7749 [Phytophthora rubi]KAE9347705.1 hypothetical protein PR003_g6783 [Phytophthora rubi]